MLVCVKQHPELKQTELMKHIAEEWNNSDEKKISDQKRAEAIEASRKLKKPKVSISAGSPRLDSFL